jgi:Ser/Thr protein kinase RdoA (MazF antagonist)
VLTDEGRLSVIDFDDAGFGWFAYDLAGAIFFQMDALTGGQQFDLLFSALSKGYLNKRPASESILEHVPTFLLIRNLKILRWIQDRPEAGHTDHIPYLLEIALAQARDLGIDRRIKTPSGISDSNWLLAKS